MREALFNTFDHPSLGDDKRTLLLSGVNLLPEDAYQPIESLESIALDHDYREIP